MFVELNSHLIKKYTHSVVVTSVSGRNAEHRSRSRGNYTIDTSKCTSSGKQKRRLHISMEKIHNTPYTRTSSSGSKSFRKSRCQNLLGLDRVEPNIDHMLISSLSLNSNASTGNRSMQPVGKLSMNIRTQNFSARRISPIQDFIAQNEIKCVSNGALRKGCLTNQENHSTEQSVNFEAPSHRSWVRSILQRGRKNSTTKPVASDA